MFIGDYVYLIAPPYGNMRVEGEEFDDRSFDLFDFFDYYRLLDLDGEISVVEQELNGEPVYYITGPIAIHRAYPVIGPSALDGTLEYWIGAEDYLLRRFEVSGVDGRGENAQRLNGFIGLSDFGESVDIQAPVYEGVDDHDNSPTNATEITVGESVTGSVDSWLDLDYFRFQAEDGQRYEIVVSDEPDPYRLAGTRATLYGPDGVTPASNRSEYSGQRGTRIEWQAPASDTYYLRVERGREGTVAYTLTVTPVE